MEAQVIPVEKPFAAAEEQFSGLVERLSSEESRRMTHSELGSLIAAEGREVHRRLLQGHLDLRAADERVRVSVRGSFDATVEAIERNTWHPGGQAPSGGTGPAGRAGLRRVLRPARVGRVGSQREGASLPEP